MREQAKAQGGKMYSLYKPDQANTIIERLDFTPRWLIDAGAGYGGEAFCFKKKWPDLQIIGLEPCLKIYQEIQPDYPGLLLNVALWSCEGRMELLNSDALMQPRLAAVDAMISNPQLLASRSLETGSCSCTTLDCLDRNHGPLSSAFLWADIEGAEIEALKGAALLLGRRAIRGLNLEVHDWNEAGVDAFVAALGFNKVFSYCYSDWHHDNLYLLGE